MASGKDLCLRSALNFNLYIKASLEAVLLAVPDVLTERLALDADLSVHGQVGELHGQQGLQVLGLQQLAVVGVVLQGEAGVAAQAEVLHVPNSVLVFVSLAGALDGQDVGIILHHNIFHHLSQPGASPCSFC